MRFTVLQYYKERLVLLL